MLTEDENRRLIELDKKINELFMHNNQDKLTDEEIKEHYRLSKKRLSEVLLEIESN